MQHRNGCNKELLYPVAMVAAVGAFGLLLTYGPERPWQLPAWIILAIIAAVVLGVFANLLYAVAAVETGYTGKSNLGEDPTGGQGRPSRHKLGRSTLSRAEWTSSLLQVRSKEKQLSPDVPMFVGMPQRVRSPQLQDAVADLEAAEYLLTKVQNGPAFGQFNDKQQQECVNAVAHIRNMLNEAAEEVVERRFAF